MDDLLDCFLDLLGELFIWEKLDRYLRKKIPAPALRCVVVSLIYVLLIGAVVASVLVIAALVT